MTREPSDYPGDREFAEQALDAALYDPRYHGNDGDRRWASAEGATAWMRYCLGRASDTGTVAVLMPASAATSRQARALRSVLLRQGVLRAVVSGLPGGRDHWLLREPDGDRPDYVLLIDATDNPAGAAAAWRAFRSNPLHPIATPYAVRVVDRLDERIDLAPAGSTAEWIDEYSALRTMLVQQPVEAPPPLRPNGDAHSMVSLGDLAEAGALSFHQSPPTVVGDGAKPMLTVKDIRLGRAPSRHGDADVPGAVITRAGDIAVVARESVVRQCADDGVLLGPGIELLRVDAMVIDSRFLAGVLRAALTRAAGDSIDLYEVGFARLPLSEQRGYADAFAKLGELEQAWHRRRTELERLVRIGYEGLSTGCLRPGDESA